MFFLLCSHFYFLLRDFVLFWCALFFSLLVGFTFLIFLLWTFCHFLFDILVAFVILIFTCFCFLCSFSFAALADFFCSLLLLALLVVAAVLLFTLDSGVVPIAISVLSCLL